MGRLRHGLDRKDASCVTPWVHVACAWSAAPQGIRAEVNGIMRAIETLCWVGGLALGLGACSAPGAPLFEGMGQHGRTVSTESSGAQTYFDQGLALCYGFNHDEGLRSFEEAARLDPDCAMAYWGQAYALSPNYNLPLSPEASEQAYAALEGAKAAGSASPLERDLIDALGTRFESPPPAERRHLDLAYADAMEQLWERNPTDTDIGFLYADALLNLSPWDLWTSDGQPKENTLEIVATLERVIELDPRHPGGNHMYIHAVEPSPNPERAEAAADRLGSLMPGVGHMVHMPSHIYVQLGRYHDSIKVNRAAIELDREYFARVGPMGIYHGYHAHNHHFLVWSAMFMGRYEDALQGCYDLLEDMPAPMHADPSVAEWLAMDVHVHIRFGEWQAVLDTPKPREDQPYAVAMWHYARGMAYANTDRIEEARSEAALFEQVAADVPAEQLVFIIPAQDVLDVARHMLAGETLYWAGQTERAFDELRAAVAAEDALGYSEPSPWMMPTRHALGALLLKEGHVEEAEQAYREDLSKHRENGWALKGLAECLEQRGETSRAESVRNRFDVAWGHATVSIEASCKCAEKRAVLTSN